MNSPLAYSVLMIIAGIGIPVMATLNGGLGARLQSPTLAATILFFVGLLLSGTYLLITEGIPDKIFHSSTPVYYYFGGFFVLFYILTITWVAPRFGISNAIAFVLLGQMIAMSLIDHFGASGSATIRSDTSTPGWSGTDGCRRISGTQQGRARRELNTSDLLPGLTVST